MQTYREHEGANGRLSDAEVLLAAADLTAELLSLIEDLQIGKDILDESVLPTSKLSFENGFRLEIATTMDPFRRKVLVEKGSLLAQFQPHVGLRIRLVPTDAACRDVGGDSVFGCMVGKLLRQAEDDRKRLSRLFNEAEGIAQRQFSSSAHSPFREDGTYCWHGHRTAH
jgi:hypothetical protein